MGSVKIQRVSRRACSRENGKLFLPTYLRDKSIVRLLRPSSDPINGVINGVGVNTPTPSLASTPNLAYLFMFS
ncbi:MAG: hypothetical protein ACI8Z1_001025 [Candidatus Azotimanducaceae bacterium]|jgi:hypothetical protein